MAYNTKYILNYCNRHGKGLRIELQLWDYVGEAFILVNEDQYLLDQDGAYLSTNIDGNYDPQRDKNAIVGGPNPFTLTYKNDIGEKGGAIRATNADMQFYEDILFNIDDLATSDETQIRAVFYMDDQIEWIGFVTPDFFNVKIEENPLITLTASDRIGILKDVEYSVASDITQNVRIIDIVSNILKQTGLSLDINIVCGMYCDQFELFSGDEEFESFEYNNPFYDSWVNEYRFVTNIETMETLNCYDILQAISNQFNCLVTQYKGAWWIINKYDLEQGKGIRFNYNSAGEYQSIERISFREEYFNLIDSGSERTIIPAGAKNTYVLDNGPEMIYPLNASLNSDTVLISDIRYWWGRFSSSSINTFDIPSEYNSNGSIKESYENEVKELLINEGVITTLANDSTNFTPVPSTIPGTSYILESNKFKVVTMDKRKSSFKLNVKGTGKPLTALMIGMFMEIEKSGEPGVKYHFSLVNEISSDGKSFSGNNVFVRVDNINSASNIPVYPFGFENKYNSLNIAVDQDWNIEMHIAAGQMQTYDISTANFFFRIYPNAAYKKNDYNQDLTEVHNILKSVSVTFLNDNQTPKGTVFQSRLTGQFTKPTDERNVMFGDYQTVGQNGFFYKYREDSLSIMYNHAGQMLRTWFTPYDSERNPLLIHSLRQLTYSYGRAHDELKIGFDMDRIDPFAHYAVRCFSDRYIQVNPEDDYLQEKNSRYITTTIGKYLNSKRFVFVEGKIDYLRSHFEGVLAQIRTNEVERQEFIYSYFEQGDIS
ncbi:hypothetical protein [Sphingobacterium lactis]|uniref:Uncharacterized protein n=1 Tax=Sphingobacterium lactis TaxID=797291 RepID=A0A1H6CSF2_9SPHI|nr:hypothetical protein [Sphingobacterium lactis]SEG75778.1 hypothetical protein SAMN05421877_11944 [Sphingobacterium lactis]